MKWFEPIIIIVAVGLVILPIILKIVNKKKGKSTCSCGCAYCTHSGCCTKTIEKK